MDHRSGHLISAHLCPCVRLKGRHDGRTHLVPPGTERLHRPRFPVPSHLQHGPFCGDVRVQEFARNVLLGAYAVYRPVDYRRVLLDLSHASEASAHPKGDPPLEIPGIPESITRKAYMEMIESWGFKLEDLKALRLAYDGVHAVVYARGPDGKGRVVQGDEYAMHDVFVPVVDDCEAAPIEPASQEVVLDNETYVPLKPADAQAG